MPDLPELIEVLDASYCLVFFAFLCSAFLTILDFRILSNNTHQKISRLDCICSQGMVSKYGHVHQYLESVKDFKERLTGELVKHKLF